MLYDTERMFFVSEYDRLNPHTREDGINNFYQYLSDKKESYLKGIMDREAVSFNSPSAQAQNSDGLFMFASRIIGDRGNIPNMTRSRNMHSPRVQPESTFADLHNKHRTIDNQHSRLATYPNDLMRMAVNNLTNMHLLPRLAETSFRPLDHLNQTVSPNATG